MIYVFGDCELDDRLYELRRTGVPLDIERKVFDVLAYLLEHRDRVVPKDELLDKLWPGVVIGEAALTRCITAARKALGDDGVRQEIIRTQHGRGYRFVAAVIEQTLERKLAAILSADVQGYSRLMGEDEVSTLRMLTAYREVTDALIQHHRGRIVGTAGDSILAEFASAVDAVQCAVDIQQALKTRNADLPSERRMEFRIGINVGDVIVEGPQIYGDGVNLAARLEALAEGGGICLSGTVYDQVENKLALGYEYLGEQTVKNIAKPVRVYRIKLEAEAAPGTTEAAPSPPPAADQRQEVALPQPPPRVWPTKTLILSGLLLLVGIIGVVQYLSLRPPAPSANIPPALSQSLPFPDKPSLVVLPFVNMSGDPGQEYFSDGITEDLTTDLSRISSLFVISRNSAFTYKGKAVKVQEVSRELGVRYVVEGSVRRDANQVRINVQLIDATTGGHVWSERYDRELQGLFALQDEVRQKIVLALKVKLTPEEQKRFKLFPTDNLEAYDYVLRGLEPYLRFTKEANAQGRQMFEKAIALDPKYAGAYTWLGWMYFMEWFFHSSRDPQQDLERAFALAQRARALDDSVPDVHQLLAWVYVRKNQPEQALAEAERALAFDPNYADSYQTLADVLNIVGRPQEAIGMAEKALRLDPRSPMTTAHLLELSAAYRSTGRVEEAIATNKQALMLDPNSQFAYTNLALSYVFAWGWQLSQDPQTLEQAFAAAQKAIALNDSLPWAHTALGAVYLLQKQPEQARAEAERTIALDPNLADGYGLLAATLNAVGKPEKALGVAEKAVHLGSPNLGYLFELGHAYCLSGRYEEAMSTLKKLISRTVGHDPPYSVAGRRF